MTTLATTLSNRYFSNTAALLRDLFLITGSILFAGALAQIKIPLSFTPVPLTGQTFAVLIIGATLGSKRSLISMVLYIMMGALGLPFFAGGASGLPYLTGPTFGYLLGFVVAAFCIGRLAEQGLDRRISTSLIPFVAGTLIIYTFGAGWLALLFGIQKALTLGVLPFLIVDAIKLILAALTLPTAWKFLK